MFKTFTFPISALAFCVLLSAHVENASPAEPAGGVTLDGVRPGMTKEEASVGLKRTNPALGVTELLTRSGMGSIVQSPKSDLQPADIAYFSSLLAASERGGSNPCDHAGGVVKSVRVLFTPDLNRPAVALIDEQKNYCNGKATVMEIIQDLYEKYSHNPTRKSGIRSDGIRLTPDAGMTGDTLAFLEWRFGNESVPLKNLVDVPLMNVWGGYSGFGNKGAGLAVHVELTPVSAGSNYIASVRTVLWDDGTMYQIDARRQRLYSLLDRDGVTLMRLKDASAVNKVMSEFTAANTGK